MRSKRFFREVIECAEEFCREYLNSDGFTFNYGKTTNKLKLHELPREPIESWSGGWYAQSIRRGELPPHEDFLKAVREEVTEMLRAQGRLS